MCVNLVLLAKGTALNISADEGGKSWPPEFGGNQLMCFQEAGVAGRVMVMALLENSTAKRVVRGDIDMTLVSEDASFDLPVGQPGMEGEREVLMHGLEGLENKGVACGSGFDSMRKGGVN